MFSKTPSRNLKTPATRNAQHPAVRGARRQMKLKPQTDPLLLTQIIFARFGGAEEERVGAVGAKPVLTVIMVVASKWRQEESRHCKV